MKREEMKRGRSDVSALERPAQFLFDPRGRRENSNRNRLNFVERDRIRSPIIQLGRPRRYMCGDGLGMLKRAAVFEIR